MAGPAIGLAAAVTTAIGLAAAVRLLQVFPFAFAAAVWSTLLRVVLVVAVVGSGIAVVVQLVQLLRLPAGRRGVGVSAGGR